MELEDYFDFIAPHAIRLKGKSIGIEEVIYYYLEGYTPEEIADHLPGLNLEQVYATITYYLRHQTTVDEYISNLENWNEKRYQKYLANPSPIVQRLRALKKQ
jgi:uncharacterized protein (DUF433 family)